MAFKFRRIHLFTLWKNTLVQGRTFYLLARASEGLGFETVLGAQASNYLASSRLEDILLYVSPAGRCHVYIRQSDNTFHRILRLQSNFHKGAIFNRTLTDRKAAPNRLCSHTRSTTVVLAGRTGRGATGRLRVCLPPSLRTGKRGIL